MHTATRISTIFAVLCLGSGAILTVIDSFVDLEAGQCPAGCWVTSYSVSLSLLDFSGVLSLIVLGLLAAVQAGRQHAWAAGMVFLVLIALSIWGALAIGTSNNLRFLLDQYPFPLFIWPRSVTPALLLALAPLPGLVLSLNPFQRASSAPVKVLAWVALVSLLLACASLWFFEQRSRQTDGPTTLAAAPQLLGAIGPYLACWLLGNILLSLTLLRHNKAPASVGR
jgi:hypothetical protein